MNKKRLWNTAVIYFVLAIVAGVFYREFTKFHGYTVKTTLAYLHTHLFVLGMFLFFFIMILCDQKKGMCESKSFRRFFVLYNIALPLLVCTMAVRGIVQVQNIQLTDTMDAMISGFAGISHILLTIALCLFLAVLRKFFVSETRE